MDNARVFEEVKRINEHCDSKPETWMADLIQTYFDSPWNAIALLAAMFHLCLSFLQTYYRIHPAKDKNDRNRARDMLN